MIQMQFFVTAALLAINFCSGFVAPSRTRINLQVVVSNSVVYATLEENVLLTPPDRTSLLESPEFGASELDSNGRLPFPSDLYQPPFEFQFPGEQGIDTLCTDPDWSVAILAMKFLGFPYTIVKGEEGSLPQLKMQDEIFDDSDNLISMLEQVYLLSDLVQTVDGILKHVRALRVIFSDYILNKNLKKDSKFTSDLIAELGRIEIRLKSHQDQGDFLEGEELTYGDLELGVLLYHMKTALGHFTRWKLPDSFPLLNAYMERMLDMEVFKEVLPPIEAIIGRYEAMGAILRS